MGALRKFQPNSKTPSGPIGEVEKTFPLHTSANQEETLATVMMTQLYDSQVEVKFNRLLLMGQNDRVAHTYPLNRNITNIGRSRRNHIRIKDALVSVKHMTVSVSGNSCVVNDLESSNGTFINGERLIGGRVLKDGEEIMVGKSVLRFAARQMGAPDRPAPPQKMATKPLKHTTATRITAAMLFLLLSTAMVYLGTHLASGRYEAVAPVTVKQTKEPSQLPLAAKKALPLPQPARAKGKPAVSSNDSNEGAIMQPPLPQVSLIQTALEDYQAGRLESTEKTLNLLSAAKEGTPQAYEAKRVLSMVNSVQAMHTKALNAQKQKQFAKALEYWDRLLIVDMELVGDRPSYFAARAEQTVQALSYEHALEAYRSKNHKKARQLCQVILKINPANSKALALLAKIDPKA